MNTETNEMEDKVETTNESGLLLYQNDILNFNKIDSCSWDDIDQSKFNIASLNQTIASYIREGKIPDITLDRVKYEDTLELMFSHEYGFIPVKLSFMNERVDVRNFIKDFYNHFNLDIGAISDMYALGASYGKPYILEFVLKLNEGFYISCDMGKMDLFIHPLVFRNKLDHNEYNTVRNSLFSLMQVMKNYLQPDVKQNKINIIYNDGSEIRDRAFTPKNKDIDIYKNYNDDFPEVSQNIIKKLNDKNKTGLFVLSGEPGTGKSTYIRYMLQYIDRKVFYVPPDMVEVLTEPGFITFLLNNPDSVLVVEDAESALQKRSSNDVRSGKIANVLNMTDGLLSDCLNISIVATFNIKTAELDSALMRKGRMLGHYEFGKLSVKKAQKLLNELGINETVQKPMALSDIYYYYDEDNSVLDKSKNVGFNKNK